VSTNSKPIILSDINIERFLSKIDVDQSSGCWIWRGGRVDGYGLFRTKAGPVRPHRVSFRVFKGELTAGLVVDHKCMNTACVNPDHLREVTVKVNNIENSNCPSALNAQKTECSRGHEYTKESTRIYRGERNCRICERIRSGQRLRAR
jgi:hypothetical protein